MHSHSLTAPHLVLALAALTSPLLACSDDAEESAGDDSTSVDTWLPTGGDTSPGATSTSGGTSTATATTGETSTATTTTGDTSADGEPLYLVATWVADDAGTNTYVAVVSDLTQDVDLSQALEVGGYGDAWVYDEWVFVADGESPFLTRYTVQDGALVQDVSLSFANYAVPSTAFFDNQILTRTKAYLANVTERRYVAWNPETMEITGTVPWPEIPLESSDLEPFHSYTDRGGEVVDGLFFHGIYQHNYDWNFFGSSSSIAVYDIATDQLVSLISVPCPMMDVMSVGNDGFLYVSGWSYMPLSAAFGLSPTNCAARIDIATRTVDPAWTFNFKDVTGGLEGMAVRVREGSEGTIAVFHGSGIPVEGATGIWDLDAGDNDWEIYGIDVSTRAITPSGTRMGSGSFYEAHLDDRYFVYLPGNDATQVYEYVDGAYVPRLSAPGWMSRLFRLP